VKKLNSQTSQVYKKRRIIRNPTIARYDEYIVTSFKYHVFVCTCPSCSEKDAENILLSLRRKIEAEGLTNEVNVSRAGCVLKGQCRNHGTFVVVYPQKVWYQKVTANDVDLIVEQHLKKGRIVSKLLFYTQRE